MSLPEQTRHRNEELFWKNDKIFTQNEEYQKDLELIQNTVP